MADGTQNHPYHLLNPSPWPILSSFAALFLVFGMLLWMRDVRGGDAVLFLGLIAIVACMIGWWRDVLKESSQGDHSGVVAKGLRLGMALFIISEVFFFFAFFWAFFWGATGPKPEIGGQWPPEAIEQVAVLEVPLLNTLLLLLSGSTLTWAHHAVAKSDQKTAFKALMITVALGFIFLSFQIYEYVHIVRDLGWSIDTTMYGATFFMATGFHGFHVFAGAVFLTVCMMRAYKLALRTEKHVGFEAAAWYWHFVDVVWLFLFVCVYLLGSSWYSGG